jgi:hypothetical protein
VIVEGDRADEARIGLPDPPQATDVGADAPYILKDTAFRMSWSSSTPVSHLQLIAVPSGDVYFADDIKGSSHQTALPVGLYRWRVFALRESGLESAPSSEGLICVVDR